jgi:ribosome-binding factor A
MRYPIPSGNEFRSDRYEGFDDSGRKKAALPATRKPRAHKLGNRSTPQDSGVVDRKAWQLCRQVGHTLDEVLADCRDAVLRGLRVDGVQPFPDASRLLVTVSFIDNRPEAIHDPGRAIERLERASGHLRSEVATAVTRKRAPLLVYRLGMPQLD